MRVVGTAGHVDHGKSSVLRQLSGMEPDRWAEERRRGLTIDLGFVWSDLTATDGRSLPVAFVDVPGHDDYLTNMLAGVSVVDDVLFVVAADDGWAVQSQEHLEIINLLGGRIVAVALTKVDIAGAARTSELTEELRARLDTVAGGRPGIFPVDALTGEGIDRLATELADRLADSPSSAQRHARLWVDRAFSVKGAGTVVTGTLQSGALEVGQDLVVLPGDGIGRIRGLQCLGASVDRAEAPARVAVDLGRIPRESLGRGVALVEIAPGGDPRGSATRELDVVVRALPGGAIGRTGAWHVHLGTGSTTAKLFPVLEDIGPGQEGTARLELAQPMPAWVGQRFVLREAGQRRTAGGGTVLDPDPLDRPRGAEQRLDRALALDAIAEATDDGARIVALVEVRDGARRRRSLAKALGTDIAEVGGLVTVADHLATSVRLEQWTTALLDAAVECDPAYAVGASWLGEKIVAAGCPPELARAVMVRAVDQGRLHGFGGRFVHDDHRTQYLAARAERQAAFVDALSKSPLEPPDPSAVAAEVGIASFEIQELVDAGGLVACGPLFFTDDAITLAVELLRAGPGYDGQTFSASDARQAWTTTRRCAVPLLEHLQATAVTDFDGSRHVLRSP